MRNKICFVHLDGFSSYKQYLCLLYLYVIYVMIIILKHKKTLVFALKLSKQFDLNQFTEAQVGVAEF